MDRTVFLLAVAAAASGMAMRSIEPILPALAGEFAVSIPVVANIITVFAVAYAIGQFIFGLLGDRFGKLRVTTVTLAASSLLFLGCASSGSLLSLGMWRLAIGLTTSASFVLGMAYIGDTVAFERRQTVIAQYVTGNVLGHAFGPMLAGMVADAFGWRGTFVFHGMTYALMACAFFVFTRHRWATELRSAGSANPIVRYAQVWKLPAVRAVALYALVESFFFFGAFAFVGPMMKLRFDLPLTLIGVALAGFGLGGLIFNLSIRGFVRRNNPRGQVLWGGLLCGSMYIAVAMVPVWQVCALCMLGVGFGFYMLHNILQTRGTEAAPQARGVGLAVFGITWTLGQGLGVMVMGAGVSTFGFAPMIAAYGVGFALLGLWMRAHYFRLP